MQRPNPGEPFLPTPANGFPPPAGYGGQPAGFPAGQFPPAGYFPPAGPQPGVFPNQFPASPFAVANPTAPGLGRRSVPTVAELFHAFKRRWVLVLMVGGLLGSVFAAGVWMALPSGKHQARALVQMRTESGNAIGRGVGQTSESEFDRFKDSELATMKTTLFLTSVASRPEVAKQPLIEAAAEKGRAVEGLLNTKWESPEILAVMMNGDDANQLKVILTAFVETYLKRAHDEEKEERTRRLTLIAAAITDLDKKIKERRDALEALARDQNVGLGTGEAERQYLTQQLVNVSNDLKKLAGSKNTLQLQLAQAKKELDSGDLLLDPDLLVRQLATVPQVVEAQKALDEANRELANFRATLLAGAPRLVEAEAKQQKAIKALAAARDDAKQGQLGDLKLFRRQQLTSDIRKYQLELANATELHETADKDRLRLEARMLQLNRGGINVVKEKDDLDPLREEKNELTKQKMTLDIAEVSRKPRVELKEGAQVYMNYNLKQKMVMAAGAGVVGLLGVMLLISFLEWRNRRVDGVDQVVTELGMRVIGTIPAFPSRASLRSGDAGANQNWRFILNESVNSTRTMLLHTAKTQQMQVIMVTSAMQGEGKTSLSSQLATSMATAGLRTLILDFDLRNPSMQKLFDVQVTPGCCEVLLQEVDVSDCVQPTTVPNLWILPAGQCNHRVIAALAQGNPVEQLLARLRGQFDVIVVDSCPILPVADSLLVAQHVDGVVFSILQDVSQLPKVLDASEKLVQLNIPLLGAVVNGIKPDIQAYGYNYVKQLPA